MSWYPSVYGTFTSSAQIFDNRQDPKVRDELVVILLTLTISRLEHDHLGTGAKLQYPKYVSSGNASRKLDKLS